MQWIQYLDMKQLYQCNPSSGWITIQSDFLKRPTTLRELCQRFPERSEVQILHDTLKERQKRNHLVRSDSILSQQRLDYYMICTDVLQSLVDSIGPNSPFVKPSSGLNSTSNLPIVVCILISQYACSNGLLANRLEEYEQDIPAAYPYWCIAMRWEMDYYAMYKASICLFWGLNATRIHRRKAKYLIEKAAQQGQNEEAKSFFFSILH